MSWEIERRYLVRVPEALWGELGAGHRYKQGYIRNGRPSLRVRTGEPRGPVLASKTGQGVKRREFEVVVPEAMVAPLMEAAGDRIIEKIRFREGPWELDRFLGALEGLALLEIELDHEDDPIPEPPPGVHILREVTDDNQFTSSHLACMLPEDQVAFVEQVYKDADQ